MKKTTTAKAKTTATKKASTKPAVAKTTVAKAAAAVSAAKPAASVVSDNKPVVENLMKKKDLIDRVVVESGMKKKDVKPIVEATLEVLAKSLAEGESMNLPPLGKVMINRAKELPNAKVYITKIRQSSGADTGGNPPLAEAAE